MGLIESEQLPAPVNEDFIEHDHKKPVDCICPKCRCIHTMQMHWIGGFTPWKYCKRCRSTIEDDVAF